MKSWNSIFKWKLTGTHLLCLLTRERLLHMPFTGQNFPFLAFFHVFLALLLCILTSFRVLKAGQTKKFCLKIDVFYFHFNTKKYQFSSFFCLRQKNMVKCWNRWFRAANGMQSTRSLVEIHSNHLLFHLKAFIFWKKNFLVAVGSTWKSNAASQPSPT